MTNDNSLIEVMARAMFEGVQTRRYEGPQSHLRHKWPPMREIVSDWKAIASDAVKAYREHEEVL